MLVMFFIPLLIFFVHGWTVMIGALTKPDRSQTGSLHLPLIRGGIARVFIGPDLPQFDSASHTADSSDPQKQHPQPPAISPGQRAARKRDKEKSNFEALDLDENHMLQWERFDRRIPSKLGIMFVNGKWV
jgi:hypothetical protein